MGLSRFIVVQNEIDAIHNYPDAPECVNYLKFYHRHTFNIKSKIEVFGDNRELEFYTVRDVLTDKIPEFFNFSKSCEMYAEDILHFLEDMYGSDRRIEVSVGEDYRNESVVANY